ncbi:hypothetical protein Droror1_Dr00020699 [Drosera rotundifolia]
MVYTTRSRSINQGRDSSPSTSQNLENRGDQLDGNVNPVPQGPDEAAKELLNTTSGLGEQAPPRSEDVQRAPSDPKNRCHRLNRGGQVNSRDLLNSRSVNSLPVQGAGEGEGKVDSYSETVATTKQVEELEKKIRVLSRRLGEADKGKQFASQYLESRVNTESWFMVFWGFGFDFGVGVRLCSSGFLPFVARSGFVWLLSFVGCCCSSSLSPLSKIGICLWVREIEGLELLNLVSWLDC